MQDACLLIKQRSRYVIKKRFFYSLSSLNFSNITLYLVGCVQNLLSFTIIAVNIYDIAILSALSRKQYGQKSKSLRVLQLRNKKNVYRVDDNYDI